MTSQLRVKLRFVTGAWIETVTKLDAVTGTLTDSDTVTGTVTD